MNRNDYVENTVARLLAGLILAPAALPLLLTTMAIAKYVAGVPSYKLDLSDALWVYGFALPAALVLGLPAHFVAQRRGAATLWWYLIGGLLIGVAVAFSFFVLFPYGFRVAMVFAWSAGIGAVSAGIFWFIVVRNPTKVPRSTG